MQLSRAALSLPLILAAAALTAGCVTVRPTGPADPPRVPAAPEPAAETRPLSPLPAVAAPPPPDAAAEPVAEPAPAERAPGAARPRRDGSPRRPVRVALPGPAPAPKARKRPPAAKQPRPAPPRTYDMGALCEAAKGTVAPSIVALCPY
ncbi:hypothetical protein AB0B01_17870 [Streptomyces sp. NPDC044571]|uniref:hypothetical protein n=1 Tax=Streptomyces sp. NPDC044571 TaxID=3155371 RepID=UPI0033E1510E